MSYTVFISHCMVTEDAPLVDALVSRLRKRGIDPYLAERDSQPGRPLAGKILDRIRNSDLVAVFWTRKGASSDWVNQEVGAAKAEGKMVVPIVEKGVHPRGMLEGLERVEFDRGNPDAALESLENFLASRHDAKRAREADEQLKQDLILTVVVAAVVIGLVVVLLLAARE